MLSIAKSFIVSRPSVGIFKIIIPHELLFQVSQSESLPAIPLPSMDTETKFISPPKVKEEEKENENINEEKKKKTETVSKIFVIIF